LRRFFARFVSKFEKSTCGFFYQSTFFFYQKRYQKRISWKTFKKVQKKLLAKQV
jgi:hypothetical protein